MCMKSKSSAPTPPPVVVAPPPAVDTAKNQEAVQKAQTAEQQRALAAQGMSSTILTGGQGLTTQPDKKKTILTGA